MIPNVLSVCFTVYIFHIYFQLIVFKLTPSEAKTFKHTVKCKLNDADKFTQVWKKNIVRFVFLRNAELAITFVNIAKYHVTMVPKFLGLNNLS